MLQAALGRRVALGPLRLSLWSGPALRAESLRIGESLSAGETAVHVAWLPLLRKRVELRSITVEDLTIAQDGKRLVSGGRLASRVRVAPDGSGPRQGVTGATLGSRGRGP